MPPFRLTLFTQVHFPLESADERKGWLLNTTKGEWGRKCGWKWVLIERAET